MVVLPSLVPFVFLVQFEQLFLALVIADFGSDFWIFFIASAIFVKSVTNFATANLAFFSSAS